MTTNFASDKWANKAEKVYKEGMKVIVKYNAACAPEYTLGKIGTVTSVTRTYPLSLVRYDSEGYKVGVKVDGIEFVLLSNDIELLSNHQNRVRSLRKRFLRHLSNPREVSITRDGLLSMDFINKRVDMPLFTDISNSILRPLYRRRFDKVAVPETSGFYQAPLIASALNAQLVPIRRGSHVPKTWNGYVSSDIKILSATKGVEDHFIIPDDSIRPGDRILLFDDFITTGNAMFGCIDVVSKSGGDVGEILTIVDKSYQQGRNKLEKEGHVVRSLMSIENYEIIENKRARLHVSELFFEKFDQRSKFIDVALREEPQRISSTGSDRPRPKV